MKFVLLLAVIQFAQILCAPQARANDYMFPPDPAAAPYVTFDSHGFIINGKRTFIVSGGIEYSRIPRALWRDRLLRLKREGFNCIEVYNFWSWQEPKEGVFDFTGDHDLDTFLKLVNQMGMYAIDRVGPYSCARWTSGGYPLWLRFKSGVLVREDNAQFEECVDTYFDHLLPIVCANQINHGGSVIMVQLENEYPGGWGTDLPNGYFTHLRDKAVSLGLQVPYFFSGLHHSSEPAGNSSLDESGRPSPWFTTEFWIAWYNQYGNTAQDALTFGRRTWQIIEHGGNGYNYYMGCGGSNFGYTNASTDAASYDFGSAVGQAGDLRPCYYPFKRAAYFARAFQDVLENSDDDTTDYRQRATNPSLQVTARKSPSGTIVFLDNPGKAPVDTQIVDDDGSSLPQSGPITLAPAEIMPIIHDVRVNSSTVLHWGLARIFGTVTQGDTTTLVVFGQPQTPFELEFSAPDGSLLPNGHGFEQPRPGLFVLNDRFSSGPPSASAFSVGAQRIRVLAVSTDLADRTWFVDTQDGTDIVVGPSYVGESGTQNGRLTLVAEQPWLEHQTEPVTVYTASDTPVTMLRRTPTAIHSGPLALGPWLVKTANDPAQPNYDDGAWLSSDSPMQMGADGIATPDAWYRTSIDVPSAGTYTFTFTSIADRAQVYIDGARIDNALVQSNAITLPLTAGAHRVAIFISHGGYDYYYQFLGSLASHDPKGLYGAASLMRDNTTVPFSQWSVTPIAGQPGPQVKPPSAGLVGGTNDNAAAGYSWRQTVLPADAASGLTHSLNIVGGSSIRRVFLNGKKVGDPSDWSTSSVIPLSNAWLPNGQNILSVLVHGPENLGVVPAPMALVSYSYAAPVERWKMAGVPEEYHMDGDWRPFDQNPTPDGPAYFSSTFIATVPGPVGPHPIYRVVPTGLSSGSIWVNGHNLGRYPDNNAPVGIYIPECWLINGVNTIVIYDENGSRPDHLSIVPEPAASRDIQLFEAKE